MNSSKAPPLPNSLRTTTDVLKLMSKIRGLEKLKEYGLDDDEIGELQGLKKESDGKMNDFKVAYTDFRRGKLHYNCYQRAFK